MTTMTHTASGNICEPCYAFDSGIDASYWHDDSEAYAHCEKHATEWSALGYLVLDIGENPCAHFGYVCIVCGTMPHAGTVYDGTLTVFAN